MASNDVLLAIGVFIALTAAALITLLVCERVEHDQRAKAAGNVVRTVSNIFALMTSLVLGVMITSARTTFEETDRSVHALASQLIVLDLTLSEYGPETDATRDQLRLYARQVLHDAWPDRRAAPAKAATSDVLFSRMSDGLRKLRPANVDQRKIRDDARTQLESLFEARWEVTGRSQDGVAGGAFVFVLAAWLIVIFSGFGYQAPLNALVVVIFVVSAALIAGTLYLVMDMEQPFRGTIRVSPAPLERALVEMAR